MQLGKSDWERSEYKFRNEYAKELKTMLQICGYRAKFEEETRHTYARLLFDHSKEGLDIICEIKSSDIKISFCDNGVRYMILDKVTYGERSYEEVTSEFFVKFLRVATENYM